MSVHRLLATSHSLRTPPGKPAVLSIRGTADRHGRVGEPSDAAGEIVLFGPEATRMAPVIERALTERVPAGADDAEPGQAGVVIEATGTLKQHRSRSMVSRHWVHAHEIRVLPPAPGAPDPEARFRRFVRDAVQLAVRICDCHKSSEGALTVGWIWPPIFDSDQRPKAHVHLYCYVMGPSRRHDWYADTLEEAMALARTDILAWLAEDGVRNAAAVLDAGAEPDVVDPDDAL